MKYTTLFGLSLEHPYYEDGRCPDFSLVPTDETARRLAGHRCLLRPRRGGLRVLTPLAEAGGAFLPLPEDVTLAFRLVLEGSDFPRITDLGNGDAARPLLFKNTGANGDPGVEPLALDPSSEPPEMPDTFALVEITVAGQASGEEVSTREFSVIFQPRQQRWSYYLVTDLPDDGSSVEIVDAAPSGSPERLLFSAGNATRLDQAPDPADRIAQRLASQYPGTLRFRFLSDEPVVCRQAPRKYLELHRAGVRLSGPLPNPSIRNVLRLDAAPPGTGAGTPETQDFLFQVVKFLSQPFPNSGG